MKLSQASPQGVGLSTLLTPDTVEPSTSCVAPVARASTGKVESTLVTPTSDIGHRWKVQHVEAIGVRPYPHVGERCSTELLPALSSVPGIRDTRQPSDTLGISCRWNDDHRRRDSPDDLLLSSPVCVEGLDCELVGLILELVERGCPS